MLGGHSGLWFDLVKKARELSTQMLSAEQEGFHLPLTLDFDDATAFDCIPPTDKRSRLNLDEYGWECHATPSAPQYSLRRPRGRK